MGLILILSFVGMFAIAAPLLVWGTGAAKAGDKQKVVAALDSAIGKPTVVKRNDPMNFRKSELISSIPILNKLLLRVDVVPRLTLLLKQANMKMTPGSLILMCLAGFAIPGYLMELRTGSILIGMGVGAVIGAIPYGYVRFKRSKRFGKFEQGLPEALDLIVGGLRAGHSLSSAIGLVTRECVDPVGGEFRITFDEQNFGLDMRVALDHMVKRVPLQDLKMAVTAIVIQRESGGNLAEVLEKTAHMVRERFRLKRQIKVHTAQGRMTGIVLTVLPVALGFGLYLINPDNESLLWKREIGVKMLIGAGVSLVIGTALIQKIVRMKV